MRYIKDILDGKKSCISCKTQQEANNIAELFKELGCYYPPSQHFNVYPNDFGLDCNGSQYSNVAWFKANNYIIYQASEFLETNYEIY